MAVDAVLSSTLQLLGTVLLNKVDFLKGVEEQVELLQDELKRMLCFLNDANNKQAHDERVRHWISEIREVALDAKDVIEMFVNKLERKGRLGKLSYYPKHVHYVNKAGKEIRSIQNRLEAIHRSRELYGIKDIGAAVEVEVEARRRLPPWQNDEHLVGMEDDVGKLLRESIMDEGKRGVSVAVVEGMGGIGKSTLARRIYNRSDVAERFNCRGWVVVSSEFKPQETMKQLILQLPRSDEEKQKLRELESSRGDMNYVQEKLREMLHKQLEGKTYFIVLDDVWEKVHWESLRSAFPDQQDKPCRLLITTRNNAIANYSQYTLKMNVLDPNKSWELFLKKAIIPNTDGKCPLELEQIGRKIVEKCNGLPLAITVVGGLLVEKHTKKGWEEVLNQLKAHPCTAESSISTILELSYQNLSPHLKACFLSLAFYKEDASIATKTLIHIWLGLGLIQQEGGRTAEEIATGYLDELINRNMVQVKNLTLDDRVKNCHLHDLLRDICLEKAKEEIGFRTMKAEDDFAFESSSYKTRHCSVFGKNITTLSLDKNDHLRSLFVLNSNGGCGASLSTPFRFWKRFQLLEILFLDGIRLGKLPHSFRSLIGLKYLRINCGSDEILKLPTWLDHLPKLETLDMKTEDVELPNSDLKMDNLSYFSAHHVHGLKSMHNWTKIETLKYIRLDDFMQCHSKLHVSELGIILDKSREADELKRVRAKLEKIVSLVKLHLVWDMSLHIEPAVFPRLNNLSALKLRGVMKYFPDASMFPPCLSHLTLVESFVNEDLMAELGKLPKLSYLKLSEYAYMGERMRVLQDGFPCLNCLSLKGMYFLSRIDVEEGGMPNLKKLRITHCPALQTKNLPECILVLVA